MRQCANLGEHRYVRQYVISARLSLYKEATQSKQMMPVATVTSGGVKRQNKGKRELPGRITPPPASLRHSAGRPSEIVVDDPDGAAAVSCMR